MHKCAVGTKEMPDPDCSSLCSGELLWIENIEPRPGIGSDAISMQLLIAIGPRYRNGNGTGMECALPLVVNYELSLNTRH